MYGVSGCEEWTNILLFLYVDGTKFYSCYLHKIKTNKTTNKAKQQTYPNTATSNTEINKEEKKKKKHDIVSYLILYGCLGLLQCWTSDKLSVHLTGIKKMKCIL